MRDTRGDARECGQTAVGHPCSVNVTQRPQPCHANSRTPGKPWVTGPVCPHLCGSACFRPGDTCGAKRAMVPELEAGWGHTVRPRKSSGLLAPAQCSFCHTRRLPGGTQSCWLFPNVTVSLQFWLVEGQRCDLCQGLTAGLCAQGSKPQQPWQVTWG